MLSYNFDKITWYGPGPDPALKDRNVEKPDIWSSTATDQWFDNSYTYKITAISE